MNRSRFSKALSPTLAIACLIAAVSTSPLSADIVFEATLTGSSTSNRMLTATDVGGVATASDNLGIIGGDSTFSGTSGDSFTMSATGYHDWSTTAAQAAITAGTFGTYLDGLTGNDSVVLVAQARIEAGDFGVNSFTSIDAGGDARDARINLVGEVLVLDFATLLAAGSELRMSQVDFALMTGLDRVDVVAWDSDTNTAMQSAFDQNYNGDDFITPDGGFWSFTSGDQLVFAAGASNGTQNWRVGPFTADIVGVAVPEPTSFAVLACGLSLVMTRRRRSS